MKIPPAPQLFNYDPGSINPTNYALLTHHPRQSNPDLCGWVGSLSASAQSGGQTGVNAIRSQSPGSALDAANT